MGTVRTVAIVVLSISFVTFVAFFGRLPVFRNTPIGLLHRVIWIHVPSVLRRLDTSLTGGRISSSFASTGNYLMNEKHPLVLIFYLGLITLCAGLFVPTAWPFISTTHHILIALLLPLPYMFTYLCTSSKSQVINAENHAEHLVHFPFDHMLYHPRQTCRTCKFEKPARSKHCSICKCCVARNDHHCIWVNTCVGFGNYKYFLLLLLSTTLLIMYGAYLAYIVLEPQVDHHFKRYEDSHVEQVPLWAIDVPWPLNALIIWLSIVGDELATALEIGGISIGGVGLLAFMVWPLPLGLLAYHIYLLWAGMTTNESSKWADWRDDMAEGVVFKAPIVPGADKTDGALYSPWPVRSGYVLLRTTDGQQPNSLPPVVREFVDEASIWDRCWRLSEVENLYDLGFWDNLVEAFKH